MPSLASPEGASRTDIPAAPCPPSRLTALDALRGFAVLLMIPYHLAWDLAVFQLIPAAVMETPPMMVARYGILTLFLLVAGMVLPLGVERARQTPSQGVKRLRRRLLLLAGSALGISLVTLLVMPGNWIFFGVLHFLTLATLLAFPLALRPWPWTLAILLVVAVAALIPLETALFNPKWLAWTGLNQHNHYSADFVPLVPWLIPYLAGILAAQLLGLRKGAAEGEAEATPGRQFLLRIGKEIGGTLLGRCIVWCGRRSLAIYIIHQPIMIMAIYILMFLGYLAQKSF